MSRFEYLLAFEAIVYGMLVTKFLVNLNNLLRHRSSVKLYWPHSLFVFSVFETAVARFNVRYYSPDYENIKFTYEILIHMIIPLGLLYTILDQLFPTKNDKGILKDHFFHNIKLIGILLLMFSTHTTLDVLSTPYYPIPWYPFAIFTLLTIPLTLKRPNEVYIKIFAVIMTIFAISGLLLNGHTT
jgi:hypothetical protein